jgi:hypothetical protein
MGEHLLMGPTDVVNHQIACLNDVARGRMVGDGEGGEKEGWEQIELR